MGPVHAVGRVQRAGEVVRRGWDDESPVRPIVQIGRGVQPHAPVPDGVVFAAQRLFLVLAIPVPQLFILVPENRKAMGLDGLP